jgi:tungstate transport system substrate-binding protein
MRRPRLRGALCAVWAILLLAVAGCGPAPTPSYLVLATTTSVQNSGLLDVLLAAYERETSENVRVLLAGSGRALKMMEDHEADIVISHAPEAEAAALSRHPDRLYCKLMFNEFLIAGPAADPAGAARASSAPEAMRRIANSGARFISRGDESGTHERERQLWRLAGAAPSPDRLVVAGAGMGSTLRVASELRAYTLTDSATFAQLLPELTLEPLYRDDPELVNTYAVVVAQDGPAGVVTRCLRLARWLTDGPGRSLIANYRARGTQPAFFVWPDDRPRDRPDAKPR